MSRSRRTACLAALAATAVVAGCGDDSATTPAGSDEFVPKAIIAIWAPTTLDRPFNNYSFKENLNTQISFSGANALAAGLDTDAKPDLFVSDSDAIMNDAVADGLVGDPVPFATDELVVAVPKDSKLDSLDDLAAGDVTVAIGAPGVPVGDYARAAIAELPPSQSEAILAGADTEGANNNGIVSKLHDGDVDAAFVYATDVKAHSDKLRAIELPAGIRPEIVYSGAVVGDGENPPGGQHFLDGLLHGAGADQLEQAGFGPPPG